MKGESVMCGLDEGPHGHESDRTERDKATGVRQVWLPLLYIEVKQTQGISVDLSSEAVHTQTSMMWHLACRLGCLNSEAVET